MPGPIALPNKLRVVFTGHAGISKRQVMERFTDYVRSSLQASGAAKTVAWADAEEAVKPLSGFLALNRSAQRERWEISARRAIQRCLSADYAFLSLHLSYRWYDRFSSPFSWRTPGVGGPGQPRESLLRLMADSSSRIMRVPDRRHSVCPAACAGGPPPESLLIGGTADLAQLRSPIDRLARSGGNLTASRSVRPVRIPLREIADHREPPSAIHVVSIPLRAANTSRICFVSNHPNQRLLRSAAGDRRFSCGTS